VPSAKAREARGAGRVSRPERERVLELIERHGWNATAFQTLEPGYRYFFDGDDACVAYVDTGRAWVAAGAPIAAHDALGDVAARFLQAARSAGRKACFFAAEERLTGAARLRSLRIGEQPVWDPRGWGEVLAGHRSLREQLRRARAKGVTVRRLEAAELAAGPTREAMQRLADRWLATREMAPMGFLVHVDPFSFPEARRCFVAEIDGRLVAFAGLIPVPARGGWFLEDLLRDPEAPNGTGELLVDAVMRWAAATGVDWLTLGLAPLAGAVAAPMRLARRGGALLYDFEGIRAYKAKLRPNAWTPIYLAFPPDQGALRSIFESLAAFARGGFLRFGVRTLLRGPTSLVRFLAALLVPWTALLALAPAQPWFPSPAVKWSWVGFDVLLAAGLFRLLGRWRQGLATALASAVSLDAALTLAQAVLWNAPRTRGLLDGLVVAAACAGPALAALLLWGAIRTRRVEAVL